MAAQVSTQRTTRSTGWAMVGVMLTLLATLFVPFGGLVVGLSIAYVVYADDEAMKRRFCMLAGVATIAWAVFVARGQRSAPPSPPARKRAPSPQSGTVAAHSLTSGELLPHRPRNPTDAFWHNHSRALCRGRGRRPCRRRVRAADWTGQERSRTPTEQRAPRPSAPPSRQLRSRRCRCLACSPQTPIPWPALTPVTVPLMLVAVVRLRVEGAARPRVVDRHGILGGRGPVSVPRGDRLPGLRGGR